MSNVKSNTFETILNEAIKSEGKIALPNIVEIEDPKEALKAISSCTGFQIETPYRFRLREMDHPNRPQTHEIVWYPKIFLNGGGMTGQFNGSGVVLAGGKAYKFTICEHDWDESGANHSRGWHPARCRKCGFDASIDSGD